MIIDTDKIKKMFADESISGNEIAEYAETSPQFVNGYRTGTNDLNNMTLAAASKMMSAVETIENKPKADIKIKGTKQAVSDFNNWQGAAAVFFDKNKKEMWTNVYASGDDQTIYRDSNVVEIKSKSSLSENWNTTTMRELKTLAVGEL